MIQKFFATHKQFAVVDTIIVEDLNKFDDATKRLCSHRNLDYVMVGGGDGTVASVLNALKDRQKIIYGFLPLGTTNLFAYNLGLPERSVKKCLEILADQHVRSIHLGSINGVRFLNFADIGIVTTVAQRISSRAKRLWGPLAYYAMGLRTLPSHPPFNCQLTIDGQTQNLRTYNLGVVNGNYYGALHRPSLQNSSVYNDMLTVVYSADLSRVGFLGDATSFLVGSQERRRHLSMIATPNLTIQTEYPQNIQADGEIIGTTPADVKIIKDAIRVLVPH